jgi:hypothetical protein
VVGYMRENKMPVVGIQGVFKDIVSMLSPLIVKLSFSAMALANLNRTVHQHNYNDLIAKLSRKLAASKDGGAA